MAKLIQAVTEFGPRIALGRTAQIPEITEMIASRTSMNAGEVGNAVSEFKEALLFYAKQGQPVKLEGLGTFTTTIDLEGNLDVGFRLDASIDGTLNAPGAFKGEALSRENIGKAGADLKALWNAEHATDQIPQGPLGRTTLGERRAGIPNAGIPDSQCSDCQSPRLGLTIPNARIPDFQGRNAPCRGTMLAPKKEKVKVKLIN